ncbi:hypothetical protein [Nostoc sp.]|uniref:hypothetical protein n=1 Tax=Nostoc sp. TaxID=1180 RepID=UPI002FF8F322
MLNVIVREILPGLKAIASYAYTNAEVTEDNVLLIEPIWDLFFRLQVLCKAGFHTFAAIAL